MIYEITDNELDMDLWVDDHFLYNEKLNVTHWYARRLMKSYRQIQQLMVESELRWEAYHLRLLNQGVLGLLECALESTLHQLFSIPDIRFDETTHYYKLIELNDQQVIPGWYPVIQCNSVIT